MSVYEQKIQLYKDYAAELDDIANREPMSENKAETIANSFINESYSRWENIWADDKELAGFFIICKENGCHPDADYFIAQLYIRPEYRRKGYAKKTVLEYMRKHRGTYCKFMIKKNHDAYAFWDMIKKEMHAKDVQMPVIPGTLEEGEEQIGFRI